MPDAEDIRLQGAYERALRMGDSASASSLLGQIQGRNQQRVNTAPNTDQEYNMQDVLLRMQATGSPEEQRAATNALEARARAEEVRNRQAVTAFESPDPEEQLEELHNLRSQGFTEPTSRPRTQDFLDEMVATYGADSPQAIRLQELATKKPNLTENIFNASVGVGRYADKLSSINDALHEKATNLKTKYQAGDFIPGFIANPLGLKNPLVEAGGTVLAGTRLNPEAIKFLTEQQRLGSTLNGYPLDALGGQVNATFQENFRLPAANPEGQVRVPRVDIAFQSPSQYTDPSSLKQEEAKLKKLVDASQDLINTGRASETESTRLKNLQDALQRTTNELNFTLAAAKASPLASEAIRYQLGSVLTEVPENTLITASPIGGAKGARARLYKGMSEGALETIPKFKDLDFKQMPTDEEFRAAWQGGGLTPEQYRRVRPFANAIATTKTGPEQFQTWAGKQIQWNPESLKDPLIRTAFGLDKDVDVTGLRQNPTNVFINTRPFDPTLPVISTASPQYKALQGVKATAATGRAGTKALLLDAGINYALGATPQEALVTAISDPISAENLGGAPTAAIERLGPKGEFVDTRSNTVLSPQGRYTNTGIAYKGGKPVVVPRGSVAGEGNILTQGSALLGNALNKWKQRLGALGIFGR